MNLPLSTNLMIAGLTVLRLLCYAIAVLFLLAAIKSQYDTTITLNWLTATMLGLVFGLAGSACGWFKRVIASKSSGG